MRILVEAFAAREGGGKVFTAALIQKLAEQNPDWYFLVFYSDNNFVKNWAMRPNLELRYVPYALGYGHRILWQQWKLRKVIKDERIDLVFALLIPGIFKPAVPQVTVHRNAHHVVPKVTSYEGGRWLKKRLLLLATIASIVSSKENIFVSEYMIDLTSHWLKPNRKHWHVIHSAMNFDHLKSNIGPVTDYKYILSVGIIHPHKNMENMIKAFAIFCSNTSYAYKLVIVGSGGKRCYPSGGTWEDFLHKLSSQCGVGDKVVFWGPAQSNILASLYRHAEICVVPSFLESFGLVPGESLFCNTPVVLSDIPAFHEVYRDAAVYFRPSQPRKHICVYAEIT